MLDMLKQIVVKYISQLFLLLTIAGLGYFAYTTYSKLHDTERRYKDLVGQSDKFQKINDYAASLERKYADEKSMRELLEKRWATEKKALEGRIKILADSTFTGKFKASDLSGALYSEPAGTWSLFEARMVRQDGKDGPPACLFQIYKDGRAVTKVYDNQVQVNIAVSRDDDSGKYTILTKASYILAEPDVDEKYKGKTGWKSVQYPLEITGGTATIDPTESPVAPRFQWWAPHLNGGVNFGAEPGGFFARPAIGLSWLGYGKTKNDLKWKFLNIGVSFETNMQFFDTHLMPFVYRPFDSFIANTYIGPGIAVSSRGTGYFLGLSLGF